MTQDNAVALFGREPDNSTYTTPWRLSMRPAMYAGVLLLAGCSAAPVPPRQGEVCRVASQNLFFTREICRPNETVVVQPTVANQPQDQSSNQPIQLPPPVIPYSDTQSRTGFDQQINPQQISPPPAEQGQITQTPLPYIANGTSPTVGDNSPSDSNNDSNVTDDVLERLRRGQGPNVPEVQPDDFTPESNQDITNDSNQSNHRTKRRHKTSSSTAKVEETPSVSSAPVSPKIASPTTSQKTTNPPNQSTTTPQPNQTQILRTPSAKGPVY